MSYRYEENNDIMIDGMKDIQGFEGLYAVTKDGGIWKIIHNQRRFYVV